ncbi:hypothetical protein Tco_0548871 [Tanacetum coccineum]
MLEKCSYDTCSSRMLMYIEGKENDRLLLDSVLNGPFKLKEIVDLGNKEAGREQETRMQTLADLTDEKKQMECDIKAANIILQELPNDIYTLLNHMKTANSGFLPEVRPYHKD